MNPSSDIYDLSSCCFSSPASFFTSSSVKVSDTDSSVSAAMQFREIMQIKNTAMHTAKNRFTDLHFPDEWLCIIHLPPSPVSYAADRGNIPVIYNFFCNCSVPSQLRVKMHSKSPSVMAFCLVCLGILAKNMPKHLAGYYLLNSY